MYTIEEIQKKIVPIAKKHHVKAIWLFGSYARGEATEQSDIDLLFDRENSDITTLVKMSAFYQEIAEQFSIPVDLVSLHALLNHRNRQKENFFKNVERERVLLYEKI